MTFLYPRINRRSAERLLAERSAQVLAGETLASAASLSHPAAVFAATGAPRVDGHALRDVRLAVLAVAREFGFPDDHVRGRSSGQAFDRAVAIAYRRHCDMPLAEASAPEVWNFQSLVLLPDVSEWRWSKRLKESNLPLGNKERWICTDFMRHSWSRLWWQAELLADGDDLGVLGELAESDLNQLLERREIGGDKRLVRATAEAFLGVVGRDQEHTPDSAGREAEQPDRRLLIRDATKRLRRCLQWTDTSVIDDQALRRLLDAFFAESVQYLRSSPAVSSGAAPQRIESRAADGSRAGSPIVDGAAGEPSNGVRPSVTANAQRSGGRDSTAERQDSDAARAGLEIKIEGIVVEFLSEQPATLEDIVKRLRQQLHEVDEYAVSAVLRKSSRFRKSGFLQPRWSVIP